MPKRCTVSSYRTPTKNTPYGPGGYNQCVRPDDGDHRIHLDAWGMKFSLENGRFRAVGRVAVAEAERTLQETELLVES